MTKELEKKPCPFCGSNELGFDCSNGETEEWVQCTMCGAQGPCATIGCRDTDEDEVDLQAEAAAAWNKRTDIGAPSSRPEMPKKVTLTRLALIHLFVATADPGVSVEARTANLVGAIEAHVEALIERAITRAAVS